MSDRQYHTPNFIPPRSSSTGAPTSYNKICNSSSKTYLSPNNKGDYLPRSKGSLVVSNPYIANISSSSHKTYKLDRIRTMAFTGKSSWSEEKEHILLGPYEYLDAQPGKDIRSQLIAAFNRWLEVPKDSLEIITKVIGMLHTSSLLIDDVQDSSLLRRGLPVAHSIFGTAQTINSANYVYFLALQELQKLRSPKTITIYTEELLNLHRGQGMDLFWRDTLTCPTEDDYIEMFLSIAPTNTDLNRDCIPLVNLIGVIFQIRDDYQNLSSQEYSENKGLCEDLTEGKFSFPIIHSIRSRPKNMQLLNILKQKTNDEQVKRYALSYMERTHSFEYCRNVLSTLMEKARILIADLDDGSNQGQGILKILERMEI
ncbi:hypothetical protein Golomagni_05099 [Golovinomyces magnicellulatus]|nr:hypothetical protein Golomagni_05099 [Golovinomyces magnicellulatus]